MIKKRSAAYFNATFFLLQHPFPVVTCATECESCAQSFLFWGVFLHTAQGLFEVVMFCFKAVLHSTHILLQTCLVSFPVACICVQSRAVSWRVQQLYYEAAQRVFL